MVKTARISLILLFVIVITAGATVVVARPAGGSASQPYRASIRWTSHGIPHVLAEDLGSAGFGQGWAYAHDRGCDLADQIVKVRSERARWFGRGQGDEYVASDIGYKALGIRERARRSLATMPRDPRDMIEGYAAGYNAYLEDVGAAGFPGWCRGKPWVRPISALDLHSYQLDLALLQSGRQLLAPIALAQPPEAQQSRLSTNPVSARQGISRLLGGSNAGSNAWAIGRERTAGASSRLVGNPHFPWQGELAFWESHVTVPGVLDVYGASLGGVPGAQIGFNSHAAWTATVSPGARHTFYSLQLADGDPTAYVVDGKTERMRQRAVSIRVKDADGSLSTLSRSVWSTRYGPVLDLSGQDPALGWTNRTALTYRDANIENGHVVEQWLAMAQAESAAEIRQVIAKVQGIPWSNTIAVDDRGTALFADAAATPNLAASAIAEWRSNPLGILDGSRSSNGWLREPGARAPGLLPFAKQPQLMRDDYVANANTSHWITNPEAPLVGYSPLQGPERTALSPRMRQTFRIIEDADGRYSGDDRRFTSAELEHAVLTDRSLTSDILADQVRDACRASESASEPTRAACAVVKTWDGELSMQSKGAILWREFIDQIAGPVAPGSFAGENLMDAGDLFAIGFDPNDPLGTPRGLAEDTKPTMAALDRAARALRAAGLPLDAGPAQAQFAWVKGSRWAVPGSSGENVGIPNHVTYEDGRGFISSLEPVTPPPGEAVSGSTHLTTEGYPVNSGTSFLLSVQFDGSGPKGKAILTYSQSMDPASPYYADQIELFSNKALRECKFAEDEIRNDPELRELSVSGRR